MPAPFVVKVSSHDAEAARALARALMPHLAARQAVARVEVAERDLAGTVASVGVISPDGTPRWIDPLSADDAPDEAAARLVAFLERWGFVPTATRTAS